MTTVGGGVKGLVARAQREAQRRAQSPSTAYLILVMLQTGGPMGRLLSQLGVKESDLLSAIRMVDSEPTSALERAVERAYRLAKATGAAQVLPAHLLLAIARDTRSAGHRSLEAIGAGSRRVQEAVQAALEPEDTHTEPTSTHIRPTASFPAQPAAKPSRPSARRRAEPAPLIELRIETPLIDLTDRQLGELALDMGVPVELCWWWGPGKAGDHLPGRLYRRWTTALREPGWATAERD